MKKLRLGSSLLLGVVLILWFSACPKPGPNNNNNTNPDSLAAQGVLDPGKPGEGNMDQIYPQTPEGELLKSHMNVATGHGENAEEAYQNSLRTLRENAEMPVTIIETYKKVPVEQYFLRTMLVEALKECRNPRGLKFLDEIASEPIGADLRKEDEEWNTQQDEEIIRITAIEGISILAAAKDKNAEQSLRAYFKNDNLSIRQMAVRGYLAYGSFERKSGELKELIPAEEHWYIAQPTDIQQVEHPEMPETFDLKKNTNSQSPKIKGN